MRLQDEARPQEQTGPKRMQQVQMTRAGPPCDALRERAPRKPQPASPAAPCDALHECAPTELQPARENQEERVYEAATKR